MAVGNRVWLGSFAALAAAGLLAAIATTQSQGAAALASTPAALWVVDGEVQAVAPTSAGILVGGDFGLLGPPTGPWAQIHADGTRGPAWPALEGAVLAAVGDGRGGWFLSTSLYDDDTGFRSALVHLRSDRRVDRRWSVRTDQTVYALARSGTRLFLGGSFRRVQGRPRPGLAVVDTRTGRLSPFSVPQVGSYGPLVLGPSSTLYFAAYVRVARKPDRYRPFIGAVDAVRGTIRWRLAADDDVEALTLDGPRGRLYVAGVFSRLGGAARERLAAVDLRTKRVVPGFRPAVDGRVNAVVPALDGRTVYLAGAFVAVSGRSRRSAAAVDARTGAATAWDPNVAGSVLALARSRDGRTLYAGGEFSSVAGVPRDNAAAFDVATGGVTAWDPRVNAEVPVVVAAGGDIFLGGEFSSVGGERRNGLALLSADGRAIDQWTPPLAGIVHALAPSPDGGRVYVGGRFVYATERNERALAVFDVPGRTLSAWSDPMNAAVWAIEPSPDGGRVYVGGGFTTVGGERRTRLAALTESNGALTAWNTGANALVRELELGGDVLFVGGDFASIGGGDRSNVAAVDLVTGRATGWDARANGNVHALELVGGSLFVGGAFETIGGRSRRYLAEVDSSSAQAFEWDPSANDEVHGLAVSPAGDRLEAVGEFTTVGGIARDIAEFELPARRLTPWRAALPYTLQDAVFSPGGAQLNVVGEGVVAVYR